MKKLHLGFGIALCCLLFVGLVHGGICWIVAETTWNMMETSFPTWAAFAIILMCYAFAAAVLLLVWLIVFLIVRGRKKAACKKQESVL